MSRRRPRVPAPPHRRRPLAVAQAAPFETLAAAHGLRIDLYAPLPGDCSCCGRRVPRLDRDGHECELCAAYCEPELDACVAEAVLADGAAS